MEPDHNSAGDSQQQQVLAAFARWSRTYELILHSASEGIFSLDTNGCITFANPAASRLLGWPVEDMLTRPVAAVLYGDKPNPLAGRRSSSTAARCSCSGTVPPSSSSATRP